MEILPIISLIALSSDNKIFKVYVGEWRNGFLYEEINFLLAVETEYSKGFGRTKDTLFDGDGHYISYCENNEECLKYIGLFKKGKRHDPGKLYQN